MSFLHGMLLGLGLALMPGPVFFALIHKSITKGFKYGLSMAIGVAISDATVIAIAYFGFMQFFSENPKVQLTIGIVGGVFTIFYGIYLFFSHKIGSFKEEKEDIRLRKRNTVAKGYFLNLLNPFMFLYWIGVLGVVNSTYQSQSLIFYFFCGTITTIFLTDLLKAYLAKLLKGVMSGKRIHILNRISGSIMVLFGLKLLFDVFLGGKLIG